MNVIQNGVYRGLVKTRSRRRKVNLVSSQRQSHSLMQVVPPASAALVPVKKSSTAVPWLNGMRKWV